MIPRTRTAGIVLAFVTAATSGVSVFVNGYGTKHFEDATVYTTSKNLVAAVLLGALALGAARLRTSHDERVPFTSRDRWGFLAVGIIGGAIPFVLFFEGLKRASSTDAAFLQKTLVVWVALLAVPLLRERLNAAHIAAIALLIVGQAKLTSGLPSLRADAASTLILGATLCWAVEVVIAKQLLPRRSALTLGAARMGIGVVALIAWVAITGRLHVLTGLSANAWGWAVLTGVLLCAYVACWYAALARAQAVDVTAVLVGGALVTAALNAAAEGVALRPQVSGLLIITIGVALACVATRYRVPDHRDFAVTTAPGPTLFARFAYPPNSLGYCGPDEHRTLLEYAASGVVDGDLRSLARGFDGAWPYLELIAAANRIGDPLDQRVVEAYWIGNDLLERVPVSLLATSLEALRGPAGRNWSRLSEVVTAAPLLQHGFHVFAVYPWVGLLRGADGGEPLRVLDRCRIRWGRVEGVSGDRATVRVRPLSWNGRVLALGPATSESALIARDGYGLAGPLQSGDTVALHWEWVCDRLSPLQLASLRAATASHLDLVNRRLLHSPPQAVLE